MCFSVLWEARNIELFLLNLFQNKAPLVMENVTLRRDILRKIMSEKKNPTEHQVEDLFNESSKPESVCTQCYSALSLPHER